MKNLTPNSRPDTGPGTHDATKADNVMAPHVVPTTSDNVHNHGPGEWDNNVYGGDPYNNGTGAPGTLDGVAGPAK